MMRKYVLFFVLVCMLMVFSNTVQALQTIDVQNWLDAEPGAYFLPDGMAPKSGSAPLYLPYYRWWDNDWGWTHTVTFSVPGPITILGATLEIEAWDVADTAVHRLTVEGI